MNTKITEKIKSDTILSKISQSLNNEIYLVGGAVRDYLTDNETTDRDIIVMDEDARDFALKVADLFEATFVTLDDENKIYRLVFPDKINYIDVTNPVGGTIEKDLMRRDLTINAIAVNIRTCEVVDITGGITDIYNKCLNYVNEHNFVDDPLRLLRVYRFQALLGFELAPETISAVCKYAGLIHKPAVERINYEILKLFSGKYADKALENMNKTWMLEEIFPFVKELKQVPPNAHHHLDFYGMLIAELFLRLEEITDDPLWKTQAIKMMNACLQLIANEGNEYLGRSNEYSGWQPEQINHTAWDYFSDEANMNGTYSIDIAWVNVLGYSSYLSIRDEFPDIFV